MPTPSPVDRIVTAARDVACETGLPRLTVAAVAARAGISTALVHYHFDTKSRLIVALARAIATRRSADRASALAAGPGLATLDKLWSSLVAEASDGSGRAYLELVALGRDEAQIAQALFEQREMERRLLSERLPGLLTELGARGESDGIELAAALQALLDGAALALLAGSPQGAVRAAYDSFWLVVIAAGQTQSAP